jgi:uncharacterized LabA/DUF88 family protein
MGRTSVARSLRRTSGSTSTSLSSRDDWQKASDCLLVKMRYYTSPLPNPLSPAYRGQQRFFDQLRASHAVELVLGRHEPRYDDLGNRYHVEKETDVNLAVDMVVGAYEDRYDVAMLVAGDTDYVRAVKAAQAKGRKVTWVHFRTQAHSHELLNLCDDTFVIGEQFLRTCR